MDPELGKKACDVELPAPQPKRKCNRVCLIAGCFVALVLLSLVELLVLPLRSFGADDGLADADAGRAGIAPLTVAAKSAEPFCTRSESARSVSGATYATAPILSK